ncbi:MAG: type II toxin-antitoxin system Phd/YefM family antitoxin [Acidimicrobiales bacterium]
MDDTMPLGRVRDHLSEVIRDVRRTHRRVTVTTNGLPAAVLISPEDLQAIEDTLDVLAEPETMKALIHNREHPEEAYILSREEAMARWASR